MSDGDALLSQLSGLLRLSPGCRESIDCRELPVVLSRR